MSVEHNVYISRLEDGSFVAASIDSPRFCVSGTSAAEAKDKAVRALIYFERVRSNAKPIVKTTRTVVPIFDKELVCA